MTTPTGRLAYGQAGAYDAIDDRAVIRAISGQRTGLTSFPEVGAGGGLSIIVRGGWLGIADCGDGTSAVVGSRLDLSVEANPGPPTGSRADYVWCDLEPDEGTWELTVIPQSTSAGRPGIPIATVQVPANATLASQMDIRAVEAQLERRVLASVEATETNTRSGTTWESVGTCITSATVRPEGIVCQTGRWYRCRFMANSPMALTSSYTPPSGRAGIGLRPYGGNDAASLLWRACTIAWSHVNNAAMVVVERTYQHSGPPQTRHFDARIWIAGTGSFRTCAITTQGPGLTLTVEDLGT